MPPLPALFRGDVWDVDFPDFGAHPAVVLSVDLLNARLGHVAVVPVTGTRGPAASQIVDAGLARNDESYADVTGLQPIDRARLLRHRVVCRRVNGAASRPQLEVYLALWPR